MKKIFFAAAILVTLTAAAANPVIVNEKVLTAFNLSFKNAEETVWSEYATHFEVCFKQGDIRSRVQYDMDGTVTEATRYYGEENLPIMLRAKLLQKYGGKKIFGVTEVCTSDETIYRIALEDNKNWTLVQADAQGSLYTYSKYRKA